MGKFYDKVREAIERTETLTEDEKREQLEKLERSRMQGVNLLITGATGCGKSSTINALFETGVSTVGVGADPETQSLERYEWDDGFTIYDSPGLGDSPEKDAQHMKNIVDLLQERVADEDGEDGESYLIDLVLVILDGSSRDLGTSYQLIEGIADYLGSDEEKEKRILVAINKADMVKSGREWDAERSMPDESLKAALEEKADSVRQRILDSTGIDVTPVCYTAGYLDEATGKQDKPYHIEELLRAILDKLPEEKRLVVLDDLNSSNFSFWGNFGLNLMESGESIVGLAGDFSGAAVDKLGLVGIPIGIAGLAVGTIAGAAVELGGAAISLVGELFSSIGDLFS